MTLIGRINDLAGAVRDKFNLISARIDALPSGGGGGSPAGSGTEVQYRDDAAFGAASKVSIGSAGNLLLGENAAQPTLPPSGTLQLYARARAGALWPEIQRSNGREIPLAPHPGLNRVATWAPNTTTSVIASGMPRTAVGTVSHPAIAFTGDKAGAMRRWRVTSAVTANAVADERSAAGLCARGTATCPGGFVYVNRFSLAVVPANARGFFGLSNALGAFSTTANPFALANAIGIGFDNALPGLLRFKLLHNDGAGTPTIIDLGADFPSDNLTKVYTLIIYCEPNGAEIGVRVVSETDGIVFETTLTTDIPTETTVLSVRNYMNNGGTASACAYDCSGVYLETDY